MADVLNEIVLDGRYEILSEVGRGQLGVVYKAKHTLMDRLVAVKILYEDMRGDENAFLRFQREAKSAGRLNHPNIITVFDFGLSQESFPYLVMDYLDGHSLHDIIASEGHLSVDRALPIFLQVSSALGHAHRRGVLHRDLKPSNTMLVETDDEPEFVKIVDFGIAKALDDSDHMEKLTLDGQICGTPAYMSPEQCLGKALDHRSDIYALGCLMFKALTGVPPINGSTPLELIAHHVSEEPLDFGAACPDSQVPAELQQVIFRCLRKNVDERQQSMRELRDELRKAFDQHNSRGQFVSYQQLESYALDAAREIERVKKAAAGGDSAAKYELAKRYRTGNGVDINVELAIGLFREAAELGNGNAQIMLAELLSSGVDVKADLHEAIKWCIKAVDLNNAKAKDLLGGFLERGEGLPKNEKAACTMYQESAGQGYAPAEYNYGRCLLSGIGTKKDLKEGIRWLTRAAHAAYPKARNLLGEASLEGQGLERNLETAVQWFRMAAQQGCAEAQYNLGACYESGQGVNQDANLAIEWLRLAAESGEKRAQWRLGHHKLFGHLTRQDEKEGFKLIKLSAEQNYDVAQTTLGDCYRDGKGTAVNLQEAINCYTKAASAENPAAMGALADCLLAKNGGKHTKESLFWYQRGADFGLPKAMFILGKALLYGDAIERDASLAEKWLRVAHNKGISEAQPLLSECYKHQMHADNDPDKRQKLLLKSANMGNAESQRDLALQYLQDPGRREEAIILLRNAAEQGDAAAMFHLAACMEGPDASPQDALRWLIAAAEANHKDAQLKLANFLEKGLGGEPDVNAASQWLRKAAEQGSPEAQHQLGSRLLEGSPAEETSKEGALWLEKAAQQGVVVAQYRLGLCYERGEGVPEDLQKAASYYDMAALQGDMASRTALRSCHKRLWETGQRTPATIDWLLGEAQSGDMSSMYQYAEYQVSLGQIQEALQWYRRAGEEGYAKAQYRLGCAYRNGDWIAKNIAEAIVWLNRAAVQSETDAIMTLAVCYAHGEGVAADLTRAVQLLTEAAAKGNMVAQAQIGAALVVGEGVRLSPVNGIKNLKGAAEMGNSFAQWKLALCYKSGVGVNKDSLEADRWFAKAAEKGFDQGLPWPCINPGFRFETVLKMFQAMADLTNKQAQHWLGVCYERGAGVPKDLDKAMHWYKLAAAKNYPPAQQDVLRLAKK